MEKTAHNIIIKACGATDVGKRASNEDAWLADEKAGLFIVADGMGGHAKGEVASWFTSEKMLSTVTSFSVKKDGDTLDSIELDGDGEADALLKYCVLEINKNIYEMNEEIARKEIAKAAADPVEEEIAKITAMKRRMGTTLVSLLIRGERAYLTHIGDSRAYRIADGGIHQMTQDHSWVAERLREGKITPEEARTHGKKNVITRSVGIKAEVSADMDVLTLHPPERFLLCSDGLSNVLAAGEMLEFAQMPNLRAACECMVAQAREKGGKDNITAVIVDLSFRSKSKTGQISDDDDTTEPPW